MKTQTNPLLGLSADQIRSLVPLAEEREACERRIGEINITMERKVSEFRMTVPDGHSAVPLPLPGKAADQIRAVLRTAPSAGFSISEIAELVGKKDSTVKAWFYQKNVPTWVKRVGRGRYGHK